MERLGGRKFDEIRNAKITKDYLKHPQGSVLIEMGDTKVICTAMIDERVPPFLKGKGTGWITAEYSMLPASTVTRKRREVTRGQLEGRTQEIKRLIGRALRSVVDLSALGERTVWIDCDVIQADGGTRTASITGGFVAMVDALHSLYKAGQLKTSPVKTLVSAISVGMVGETHLLDLCYAEDSKAKVDMNIVMTDGGEFVEIQGTGEEAPFNRQDLNELIRLAEIGNKALIDLQKEVLGDALVVIADPKKEEGKGE